MPVVHSQANGHDELRSQLRTLQQSNKHFHAVYILFTGTKLADTGKSWCPDCVKAEPIIEQALKEVEAEIGGNRSIAFITCNVGLRDEWKTPNNSIKMDDSLGVHCIPTLLDYSLGEGRCIEGRKLDRDGQFMVADTVKSFIMK